MNWTDEQEKRLKDLGASLEILGQNMDDAVSRNKLFQQIEKKLAKESAEKIRAHCAAGPKRPEILILEEKLAQALVAEGFTQVSTPLTVSKKHLSQMGINEDHPLNKQIFWLDKNKAMRPMLAPNLYYVMVDLLRILPHPVSIFEIGPCMRKETQGAQHTTEFTMLNLTIFALPLEERKEKITQLAQIILKAADLPVERCPLVVVESGVYGETIDVESPDGLELASTAMGPHPLDGNWGVTVPWVGLGFGLERLVMARAALRGEELNPVRSGRSLSYLAGQRLNV